MFKRLLILSSFCFLFSCKKSEVTPDPVKPTVSLTKVWETTADLKTCESVIYDAKNKRYYVSNIAGLPPESEDGDGSISIVGLDGKIITIDWITGLDAPKGMGIYNDILYVTDINEVVAIDIAENKVKERIAIEGATFLNDIDIDTDGTIYITDTFQNKIHKISGTTQTVFLDKGLSNPNGLLIEADRIGLAQFGAKNVLWINKSDLSISEFATEIGGGDGLEKTNKGNYLVSDWNGQVFIITPAGVKTKILDTLDKENAADIEYDKDNNLVLVPTFSKNKVVAYKLTE